MKLLDTKLTSVGDKYFAYHGQCKIYTGKDQDLKMSVISPLMLEIARQVVPKRIVDDNRLNIKYSMAAKYAMAEYNSISMYAVDEVHINEQGWQEAEAMLYEAFNCMQESAVMTMEGALEWVDKTTSPGYPWMLEHGNKTSLFTDHRFMSHYHRFEREAKEGVFYPLIYRCFIKKELKKMTDLEQHMPRTITAAPAESSLLGIRLFGHMNGKMSSAGAAGEIPCYIGASRFHGNWNDLAIRLEKHPNIADGDCTKFDRSVQEKSLMTVARFRNNCLVSPGWSLALFFYYAMVIYTLIIGALGDLFQKMSGQPSGQGNTLHDNSLIQCLYWFYHWCTVVAPNTGLPKTWSAFNHHVCLITMGDDVIYSYSNKVAEWMSPPKIENTFAILGVKFKYSFATPMPLEKLEFCSTNFKKIDGMYLPTLRHDKMLGSVFYYHHDNHKHIYRRLLALRIEGWQDIEFRRIINETIDLFRYIYRAELMTPPTMVGSDTLTYTQINELRWTPWTIERHYRCKYQ
jgi:hypothetical protein